jgi:hypothetical protein
MQATRITSIPNDIFEYKERHNWPRLRREREWRMISYPQIALKPDYLRSIARHIPWIVAFLAETRRFARWLVL